MRVNRTIRRSLIRIKIIRKKENIMKKKIKTRWLSIIRAIRIKWMIRVQMLMVIRLFYANDKNNDNYKNNDDNENNDQNKDR